MIRTIVCLIAIAAGASAQAASWDLRFIHALRDRGLYDYALAEFDRIQARPNTSPDLRTTLEFERGVTVLQFARTLVNADAQAKEFERAEKLLEAFSKAHPADSLAAKADVERGQVLLDRARAAIWHLRPSEADAQRGSVQADARRLIARARDVFKAAHDRSQAEVDRFPKTAPTDPAEKESRMRVETNSMRAQISLALCDYEDAVTYPEASPERKKSLTRAAEQFQQIHVRYRSQGAGLRARLWQGKCVEEQGNLREAQGIYAELLAQKEDAEVKRQVKDAARQFRLAALNKQAGKEAAVVIQEATEWLDAADGRQTTATGLGIRWQRGVAAMQLAEGEGQPSLERARWKKSAADDAREVSRYPGEFQAAALSASSKLSTDKEGTRSDPRDFTSGFNVARKLMTDLQTLTEKIDDAKPDERSKLDADRRQKLEQAAGHLSSTIDAARERTNPKDLNQARYFLAYVDYELGRNDEAAIIALFAGQRLRTLDAELARETGRLSLAASEQEFHARPEADRPAMARSAKSAADFLIKNWPDHERANEARMTMARLFDRARQPLEAANWYATVKDQSTDWPEAQVGAGREYWIAAQTTAKESAKSDPRIAEWEALAEKHLKQGIAKAEDEPVEGATRDWLVIGKAAYANIHIAHGRYAEAEKLLASGPNSVVAAVAVPDGTARPADGVKGRAFAGYVMQSLLRAEIGLNHVDDALQAMHGLEQIAGAADGDAMIGLYVSLGKEIQKEIARLTAAKDAARLTAVRQSFDAFLENLATRKSAMTYGSMLWIAETYAGLADALEGDEARAFYQKAANGYSLILERDRADDNFVAKDREPGLKLRWANCLRKQEAFDQAIALVRSVIAEKPKALDAQVAAAELLEEWGMSGPGNEKHSLEAIQGSPDPEGKAPIWGWAEIARRLQRLVAGGKADEEFRQKYFDARLRIPASRRMFALAQTDRATRDKVLGVAMQEVEAFAAVAVAVPDESWNKFATLYGQLQHDLGRPQTPLARGAVAPDQNAPDQAVAKTPEDAKQASEPAGSAPSSANATPQPASGASRSSGLLLAVLALFAVGSTAGAIVWMNRRAKQSRRALRTRGPGARKG